jgi:GAF domain-containing protein
MNPVQPLLNWLNPIPPEHQALAPVFDAENQAALRELFPPTVMVISITLILGASFDYLIYRQALWSLLSLRASIIVVLWLIAAIAHWRREQIAIYPLVWGAIAIGLLLAGGMLVVNNDPAGPYTILFTVIAAVAGVAPWPAVWMLRANLTNLAIYLIIVPWLGKIEDPSRFFVSSVILICVALLFAAIHTQLNRLRWDNFLNRRRFAEAKEAVEVALRQVQKEKQRADDLLGIVIPVGVALSGESDFSRLLEKILLEAMSLCRADAGTLYMCTDDDMLRFEIVRNDSLNIALGGTTGQPVTFPPLCLYDESTGEPNHHYVVTHAALTGSQVNIANAYQAEGFDFSGTKAFDERTGYRSISFLNSPLKNSSNQVIGVLQLINALDPDTGQVIPFDQNLEQMIGALSLLASVALEAYYREQQLRRQIAELQIEIDKAKAARQVAEITETEYFQDLQKRAGDLRRSRKLR